jgi:excinuclease UvrABC nuclease subunit
MSRKWTGKIPPEAGVYVLKENENIVYVGETGNLR